MSRSKSKQTLPLTIKEVHDEGYRKGFSDCIIVFFRLLGKDISSQINEKMINYYHKVCTKEKRI